MRFLIHIVAVFLLSWLLQSFFPWWTLAVASFIAGLLFGETGFKSFIAGFIGAAVLWLMMAWYIDSSTDSILTSKVAQLFPTKTVGLLIVFTAIIGGLVGGFASMTGGILTRKERQN